MFANVQNICNLIGRVECNIGHIVPLVSILESLTKKLTTFDFRGGKKQKLNEKYVGHQTIIKIT